MARPLRRKHQKSSLSRTTQPSSRRKPSTKRLPLTNPLVAAKWDKKLTLAQNYRRLGLSSKLNVRSGGVEKVRKVKKNISGRHGGREGEGEEEVVLEEERDALAFAGGVIAPSGVLLGKRKRRDGATLGVGTTKVIRDADGKIISVLPSEEEGDAAQRMKRNPLNDPLNDLESSSEDSTENLSPSHQRTHIPQHSLPLPSSTFSATAHPSSNPPPSASRSTSTITTIIPTLEALASAPQKRKPRPQSTFEQEWIERLVAKHGDDVAAMSRDRKMNPRQQTEGDIGRRVRMWKEWRWKVGQGR